VDTALGSYGIRELKRAVARDLEALLNTAGSLEELPESLEGPALARHLRAPGFHRGEPPSLRD